MDLGGSGETASETLVVGIESMHVGFPWGCVMAAEAKPKLGGVKRWLQKRRESWRQAGDMGGRASAARRTDTANAEKRRPDPRDPGSFSGL
jgi:hypothetical protein